MARNKEASLKLIFNTEADVKYFIAMWLDGGGEQMCGYMTEFDKRDWSWLKLTKCEEEDDGLYS